MNIFLRRFSECDVPEVSSSEDDESNMRKKMERNVQQCRLERQRCVKIRKKVASDREQAQQAAEAAKSASNKQTEPEMLPVAEEERLACLAEVNFAFQLYMVFLTCALGFLVLGFLVSTLAPKHTHREREREPDTHTHVHKHTYTHLHTHSSWW